MTQGYYIMRVCFVSLVLTIFSVIGQNTAVASPQSSPSSFALPANGSVALEQPIAGLQSLIESRPFYGLSQYLNAVNFYKVTNLGIEHLPLDKPLTLGPDEWLAAVGRFNVLALKGGGITVTPHAQSLDVASLAQRATVEAYLSDTRWLESIDPLLDQVRYAHLWAPLAALAKGLEWLLTFIQRITGLGWGIALILYAVVLKLILLPASLATAKLQARVEEHQRELAPQITAIKQAHSGEQAHNLIMQAHKDLGLSPFYTLKPMLGLLVQIPVLIATFNALAQMPALAGIPFLWVHDLAYPDAVLTLPIVLPVFGNTLNLMPILMALVSILASLQHQDVQISGHVARRKRLQQIGLALVFLVFFYTFPSAMVLYWLLANALQWAVQRGQRVFTNSAVRQKSI